MKYEIEMSCTWKSENMNLFEDEPASPTPQHLMQVLAKRFESPTEFLYELSAEFESMTFHFVEPHPDAGQMTIWGVEEPKFRVASVSPWPTYQPKEKQ